MSPHPPQGGLLALDLGSTVGLAYGMPEWRHATLWHRACRINNGPSGETANRFTRMLYATIQELRPGRVCAEAPLRAAAMNHDAAMLQQIGLTWDTLEACWSLSVPYYAMGIDDVRGEILQQRRFPKGVAKLKILEWARRDGYRPANTHEADAAAVWEAFARLIRRGAAIPEAVRIGDAALDVGLVSEDEDVDA